MAVQGIIDISQTPVTKLRDRTKTLLSASLNQLRVIPTDDNIPRDWRGVAHFAEVNTRSLSQSSTPFEDVLKQWVENKLTSEGSPPTFKDLQDILGQIDRWDVYDDSEEMMKSDAEYYSQSLLQIQPAPHEAIKPFQNGCLTTEDVERVRQGLPLIKYDAFLLYADEDLSYAKVMIDKLENNFKLRLVVKDRDLLSGVGLEFSAITKLIAERCSSLIVILSPNLLNSHEKMFFLSFAQTISITQQNERNACKRIVPCRYEPCSLPIEISYLYCLDYRQASMFGNFWPRLRDSIMAAIDRPIPNLIEATSSRCEITEITSQEMKSQEVMSEENLKNLKNPEIKPLVEPRDTVQNTAEVVMSDPSTHYPGSSLEETPDIPFAIPEDTPGQTSKTNRFFNLKHLTNRFRRKDKKEKLAKKKMVLAA
ncbi:myeloid differentiation primary response protein MyD88 isoform X2 [Thrips palmi]|uniref:Myeloid differentiation primary response protein MyD88 isoform X2 n=1 Tax=Thrips palmi TaxID=161013 RepID=A0A6P8Z4Q9_THRPL|nr:myeloid differentiation primary response protein MyD88 isoform X2 [Thrips palmi]